MNCGICIHYPKGLKDPCLNCTGAVVMKKKPQRQLSAWERRWIRWAKKERSKK